MKHRCRLVFEVEESPILNSEGGIKRDVLDGIAMILSNLMNFEIQVILVSAGAIASGIQKMDLKKRDLSLTEKQALAAIGQVELIKTYQNIFAEYNHVVAQVLLTRNIIDNEKGKTNAKNTFKRLLLMGIIPVINENDTLSTEDIEQENNYELTSSVATIVNADLLVVLNEDLSFNLYRGNPKNGLHISGKTELFSFVKNFIAGTEKHNYYPKTYKELMALPVEENSLNPL